MQYWLEPSILAGPCRNPSNLSLPPDRAVCASGRRRRRSGSRPVSVFSRGCRRPWSYAMNCQRLILVRLHVSPLSGSTCQFSAVPSFRRATCHGPTQQPRWSTGGPPRSRYQDRTSGRTRRETSKRQKSKPSFLVLEMNGRNEPRFVFFCRILTWLASTFTVATDKRWGFSSHCFGNVIGSYWRKQVSSLLNNEPSRFRLAIVTSIPVHVFWHVIFPRTRQRRSRTCTTLFPFQIVTSQILLQPPCRMWRH